LKRAPKFRLGTLPPQHIRRHVSSLVEADSATALAFISPDYRGHAGRKKTGTSPRATPVLPENASAPPNYSKPLLDADFCDRAGYVLHIS
jgi:hypothetical protein